MNRFLDLQGQSNSSGGFHAKNTEPLELIAKDAIDPDLYCRRDLRRCWNPSPSRRPSAKRCRDRHVPDRTVRHPSFTRKRRQRILLDFSTTGAPSGSGEPISECSGQR